MTIVKRSYLNTGNGIRYLRNSSGGIVKIDSGRVELATSEPTTHQTIFPIFSDPIKEEFSPFEATKENFLQIEHHEFGDNSAVLRCDYFFTSLPSHPQPVETDLAPKDSYYQPQVATLLSDPTYSDTYSNLMSWYDMDQPITKAEVHLMEWVQDGKPVTVKTLQILKNLVSDGLRVVMCRSNDGVSHDMKDYPRESRTLDAWLQDMYLGSRGIPFPLVVAIIHSLDSDDKDTIIGDLQDFYSVGDLIRDSAVG